MKQIRMGVIGCGLWGQAHMEVIRRHPQAKLVAVCDLDGEKARRAAGDIEGVQWYDDFRRLVRADLDAVSIVTPDSMHAEPVIAAAQAGRHMLIEKPLATTRQDLERVMSAIRRSGVRAMVDLHNRWSPPFAVTKQEIDKGTLGTIVSAYFRLNDRISVPTEMLSWVSKSSILWFLGSHTIDTLRWLTGDEIEVVYALCHRGVLEGLGIDAADLYQTVMKFRRGAIASIENSWILPNSQPCVNDIKFNVTGTRGMINMDLSNNQLIERFTENESDRPDILVKHFVHGEPRGFAYESIRSFIDSLSSGTAFLVSLEDAAKVTEIVLAIIQSAQTGMPVRIEYEDYL